MEHCKQEVKSKTYYTLITIETGSKHLLTSWISWVVMWSLCSSFYFLLLSCNVPSELKRVVTNQDSRNGIIMATTNQLNSVVLIVWFSVFSGKVCAEFLWMGGKHNKGKEFPLHKKVNWLLKISVKQFWCQINCKAKQGFIVPCG